MAALLTAKSVQTDVQPQCVRPYRPYCEEQCGDKEQQKRETPIMPLAVATKSMVIDVVVRVSLALKGPECRIRHFTYGGEVV